MSDLHQCYERLDHCIRELKQALDEEKRVVSREYYRSQARRLDEADVEVIKGVAEQMSLCIRKNAPPDNKAMTEWINRLLSLKLHQP